MKLKFIYVLTLCIFSCLYNELLKCCICNLDSIPHSKVFKIVAKFSVMRFDQNLLWNNIMSLMIRGEVNLS